LAPKVYGHRLNVTSVDRPLADLSDEELDARLRAALSAAGVADGDSGAPMHAPSDISRLI